MYRNCQFPTQQNVNITVILFGMLCIRTYKIVTWCISPTIPKCHIMINQPIFMLFHVYQEQNQLYLCHQPFWWTVNIMYSIYFQHQMKKPIKQYIQLETLPSLRINVTVTNQHLSYCHVFHVIPFIRICTKICSQWASSIPFVITRYESSVLVSSILQESP